MFIFHTTENNNKTAPAIWPSYTSACVSWHPQLRTGGLFLSKVLLHTCPYWQQLAQYRLGRRCAEFDSALRSISCISSIAFSHNVVLKLYFYL